VSFPPGYQLPSFRPYKKAPGAPDLDAGATTADFRAIANSFHSEFFAEHPDTEIFTSIVKLLLAKIYDERQRKAGEQYHFQVLQKSGREETAASVFARIAALYELAYGAYIDPAGGDALDPKVFAPERVKSVVKGLQGLAITRGAALHGDIIGTFFEEILRAGFKQDKGMYFTHANLVWFMLESLDLTKLTQDVWRDATHPNQRMPYVIDPACGSGTFLLRAMQMMSSAIRDNKATLVQTHDDEMYFNGHLSDLNPNDWAKDFLYGCDPKFVMAITAKVNMVLHGDGSAHVYKWDGLRALSLAPDRRLQPLPPAQRSVPIGAYPTEVSEQFDVVISNPPFGITLAPETRKDASWVFTLGSSAPSESLFLERWAQLLKPKGRLAVVVPESLLNTGDSREARLFLLRFFHIRAVVSLPRNLFIETPTLTSLLFAQKKTEAEIAQWDTAWTSNSTKVDLAIARARKDAKAAAKVRAAKPANVETAFLTAMAPYLLDGAFVKKRGKKPAILRATLPKNVTTAVKAVDYYESFVKAGGFAHLRKQAILRLMAATHNYSWPAYAVDEVGYKLSKRGERVRPNHLCGFYDVATGTERPNVQKTDAIVKPRADTKNPKKVLDYLRRDITWA
jgi:type I restriction enzyme M protein